VLGDLLDWRRQDQTNNPYGEAIILRLDAVGRLHDAAKAVTTGVPLEYLILDQERCVPRPSRLISAVKRLLKAGHQLRTFRIPSRFSRPTYI
jgi:hypothetical protein